MTRRGLVKIYDLNKDSLSKIAMLWGNSYFGQLVSFVFIVFVIRDLGLHGFGLYAMSLALTTLGALAVDFGVSGLFSGYVSSSRMNGSRAKSDLRTIRLALACAVLIVGGVSIYLLSFPPLFFLALAIGVGSVFEHSWLLQAEGQVRQYVSADLLTRITTLLAWLLFSRFDATPELAIASVGAGFFVRSIYTGRKTKLSGKFLTKPTNLNDVMRASFPLAASKLLNSTTNQLTPLVFGVGSSTSAIGTFASADKPIRALQSGANSYAVFALPKISQHLGKNTMVRSLSRHLMAVASLSAVLALAIFFSAPILSFLLVGSYDAEVVACVRIMAVVPLFTAVNNVIAVAVSPVIGRSSINLYAAFSGVGALGVVLFLFPRPLTPQTMALGVTFIEFSICAFSLVQAFWYLSRNRGIGRIN